MYFYGLIPEAQVSNTEDDLRDTHVDQQLSLIQSIIVNLVEECHCSDMEKQGDREEDDL